MLKVLVACEESQAVCKAFRDKGCEAYSCDIQSPTGEAEQWHILGDCLPLLNGNRKFKTMDGVEHEVIGSWDIVIGFPSCTYLSNAGACRLYPKKGVLNQERYQKGLEAKEFFLKILNANCDHVAVENPVSSKVFNMPQHSQEIQPWMFGHPYTKKTRLWLRGLPPLEPTDVVKPIGPYVCGNAEIWKEQAKKGVVYGKEKSSKHRSKTFSGVASAMANRWCDYVLKEKYKYVESSDSV